MIKKENIENPTITVTDHRFHVAESQGKQSCIFGNMTRQLSPYNVLLYFLRTQAMPVCKKYLIPLHCA